MIKIEHLRKEYPNVTPLNDVSVEINDGDVISVIGPSGTGKRTLLRCINQMEKPSFCRTLLMSHFLSVISTPSTQIRPAVGFSI